MVGNAKVTYPHVIYVQIKTRSHLKNTFTTLILGEGFFLCQNQKFSIYFEDDCLRHVAGVLIGMSVIFRKASKTLACGVLIGENVENFKMG